VVELVEQVLPVEQVVELVDKILVEQQMELMEQ
jgi:hypothetical protein